MNEQASLFYQQAGAEVAHSVNGAVDRGALESFSELAKVHQRKVKFLKLRLQDPTSLYDIGDIRAKMRPKQQKVREEEMVRKGLKVPGKFMFKTEKGSGAVEDGKSAEIEE